MRWPTPDFENADLKLKAFIPYLLIVVKTIIYCFGKFLRHFDSSDIVSCSVMFFDGWWGLCHNHDFVYILIIYFIIRIVIPKNTNFCQTASKHFNMLHNWLHFVFSTHFSVFGYSDETLFLVLDILHEKLTILKSKSLAVSPGFLVPRQTESPVLLGHSRNHSSDGVTYKNFQ